MRTVFLPQPGTAGAALMEVLRAVCAVYAAPPCCNIPTYFRGPSFVPLTPRFPCLVSQVDLDSRALRLKNAALRAVGRKAVWHAYS